MWVVFLRLSIHLNFKIANLLISSLWFPSLFLPNIIVYSVVCTVPGYWGSSNEQDRHDPYPYGTHRISFFLYLKQNVFMFSIFLPLTVSLGYYLCKYLSGSGRHSLTTGFFSVFLVDTFYYYYIVTNIL